MAEIIGEGIVKVVGDITGLRSALNSAQQLSRSSLSEIAESMATANVFAPLVAGAVAAGSAVIALTVATTKYIEGMNLLSQSTGMSLESLSGLRVAFEGVDLGVGDISTSIKALSNQVTAAAQGNETASMAFVRLGVSVRTANGDIRSSESIMRDVADRFATMADGAAKSSIAVDLFGRAGSKLIPVLNQGSAGLDEATVKAGMFGVAIGDRASADATRLDNAIDDLVQTMKGIGITIGSEILPGAEKVVSKFNEWYEINNQIIRQDFASIGRAIGASFSDASGGVTALGGTLQWLLTRVREMFQLLAIIPEGFSFFVGTAIHGFEAMVGGLGVALGKVVGVFSGEQGRALIQASEDIVAGSVENTNRGVDSLNAKLSQVLDETVVKTAESVGQQKVIFTQFQMDMNALVEKNRIDHAAALSKKNEAEAAAIAKTLEAYRNLTTRGTAEWWAFQSGMTATVKAEEENRRELFQTTQATMRSSIAANSAIFRDQLAKMNADMVANNRETVAIVGADSILGIEIRNQEILARMQAFEVATKALVQQKVMTEEEAQDRLQAGWEATNVAIAESSQTRWQQQIVGASDMVGAIGGLLSQLSTMNEADSKKQFDRNKKFQIAAVVMNTAAGIMKALGTSSNIYEGIVYAALVAATGLIQIQKISSTQYQGAAAGGLDEVPNTGTFLLHEGEAVVPREPAERLRRLADILPDEVEDRRGGGPADGGRMQIEFSYRGSERSGLMALMRDMNILVRDHDGELIASGIAGTARSV